MESANFQSLYFYGDFWLTNLPGHFKVCKFYLFTLTVHWFPPPLQSIFYLVSVLHLYSFCSFCQGIIAQPTSLFRNESFKCAKSKWILSLLFLFTYVNWLRFKQKREYRSLLCLTRVFQVRNFCSETKSERENQIKAVRFSNAVRESCEDCVYEIRTSSIYNIFN